MYRPEFVNVRQHHFDALRLGLESAVPQERVEPDQAAARPVQPVHLERQLGVRLTLVSLVPNRNTDTRLRASVMAWRKCRNSRVYSLIEPDISSSATIGAGLSMRPSFWISMISPPVRRLPRSVRRMSSRSPRASGW